MNSMIVGAFVLCCLNAGQTERTLWAEPYQPAACNGKIIFAGVDKDRGEEPWVTDGTGPGTRRLKDIWPGPKGSCPSMFATIANRVVFWAEDAAHGRELWITDGTEAGTTSLTDIRPGTDSSSLSTRSVYDHRPCRTAVFNGALYFFARPPEGGSGALYRTDGTAEGTVCLISGTNATHAEMVASQDGVYMFNFGDGIWKTDGSPLGTAPVAKVKKWERDSLGEFSSPDREISWRLVCVGRTAFFAAHSQEQGIELWMTDGTEAGTTMVRDIRKGFGAGYAEGDRCSHPQWLTAFNSEVYFVATDDVDTDRGRELWKSNGTAAGTVMVKDINPGRDSSRPAQLIVWNNALYFTAKSVPGDPYERAIWRTDGTESGTMQLPGSSGNSWPMAWPVVFGNHLYVASDYQASLAIGMLRPGAGQVEILWRGGRESDGYQNPLWTVVDDRLFYLAEGNLWNCARRAAQPQ